LTNDTDRPANKTVACSSEVLGGGVIGGSGAIASTQIGYKYINIFLFFYFIYFFFNLF
jgi:hypothetical protein